jgi:hypothetical protein
MVTMFYKVSRKLSRISGGKLKTWGEILLPLSVGVFRHTIFAFKG